jgi:hypothetical protein
MRAHTLFLISFFVFQSFTSQGQGFGWAKKMGGSGDDQGQSVTVDTFGNIYITGGFSGTVDFDPGPALYNMTSAGDLDIYVVKLNAVGGFLWAKSFGSVQDDFGTDIAIDHAGNVHVTGAFYLSVDFDPSTAVYMLYAQQCGSDGFLLKLDPSGNFLAAIEIGNNTGCADEMALCVTVDVSGDVLVGGRMWGTVDFDPSSGVVLGTGVMYALKLSPSYVYQWARTLDPLVAWQFPISDIVTDSAGNVYIVGRVEGTTDYDPGPAQYNLGASSPPIFYQMFIWKLSSFGTFLWVKPITTSTGNQGSQGEDGIAVNSTGVYITGESTGTVDFDPGPGVFNLTSSTIAPFLLKLDTAGNFLFATQFGSSGVGYDVTLDDTGNVYVGGYFTGTADFDPGPGAYNLTASGGVDGFIVKLNPANAFVGVFPISGAGSERVQGLHRDPNGRLLATGYFSGSNTDFDPGFGVFNMSSSGSNDAFVLNLSQCTAPPSPPTALAGPTPGCPGNTYTYSVVPSPNVNSYTWTLPNQWTGSSSSNSITAISSAYSGNVTVVATNNCGSSVPQSLFAIINGNPPSPVITAGGPLSFCAGDSVNLATAAGSVLSYQWLLNSNNISGANMANYYASLPGSYSIVVSNNNCSITSAPVVVTNLPLPVVAVSPTDTAAFCSADSLQLQASPLSIYTFQWEKNGLNIPGASAGSYTVYNGGAGTYKVRVSDGACSFTSGATHVIEAPSPIVTISLVGGTLFASGSFLWHQWYYDNLPIMFEHDAFLNTFTYGSYYVVVTDSNGCTGKSNTIVWTDVGEVSSEEKILIYPSPVRRAFNFLSPETGTLNIFDLMGRKLAIYHVSKGDNQLWFPSQAAAGTYLASFTAKDGGRKNTKVQYMP